MLAYDADQRAVFREHLDGLASHSGFSHDTSIVIDRGAGDTGERINKLPCPPSPRTGDQPVEF